MKTLFEKLKALRIYAVSKRSEQLFCNSKAHNFSLSKIGICLECKSKEPVGANEQLKENTITFKKLKFNTINNIF